MDYHVIIVIACVFLASLFSILFINKFFKNKTYEEAAAEKKALVEKLYPTKISKKVKKFPGKKDAKKEKKQRQFSKDSATENDVLDSDDIEDEESQSGESSPTHVAKSKPHVEFSQASDASSQHNSEQKTNKLSQGKKKATKTGILVNKTETSPVQESIPVETMNHFEKQHPKDFIELKKPHKDEHTAVQSAEAKHLKVPKENGKKMNKPVKREIAEPVTDAPVSVKEVKLVENKATVSTTAHVNSVVKTESPKSQGNKKNSNNNNKSKSNAKEISLFDKIGSNDVIGVNSLMQLFAKAELNRNDIQILIDFLLNKQQDTAAVAHEWSDDVVTKLRKQLAEKEKALQEEIEASGGIQAKLKELRVEINAERAQFNANMKAFTEELQTKKNEIILLTSEIQNMNEKLQSERQQFQVKMRHEKQANSQDFLTQIQQLSEHNTALQNEIAQKNTYVNELQRNANALVENFEQKLTSINEQNEGKIQTLESSLAGANENIQRLQYDLEMAKLSENEKENSKVEIRNLQNALETTKSELIVANKELDESQFKVSSLNNELREIRESYDTLDLKCQENNSSAANTLKNSVDDYNQLISEKDGRITEYEGQINSLISREKELLDQLAEQKEKNNDLRTKNWKLNEALQSAETNAKKLMASNNKFSLDTLVLSQTGPSGSAKEGGRSEKEIRDIFQRLFPEAVKKHAATALSISFEQWINQVLHTHTEQLNEKIKLNVRQESMQNAEASSDNSKSHNSNHKNNNNHYSPHNHNSVCSNNSEEDVNISNFSSNSSNINNISKDDSSGELLSQNIKLKAQIEELTSIVTKTESVLQNLETQAREQDAHWRNMVEVKQDEINLLRKANGETS